MDVGSLSVWEGWWQGVLHRTALAVGMKRKQTHSRRDPACFREMEIYNQVPRPSTPMQHITYFTHIRAWTDLSAGHIAGY